MYYYDVYIILVQKVIEELNIIIKSDVQGSSEALKNAINKIEHAEVKANIILSDIGMINESDVSLAKASNALLIGFNVKPNNQAKKLAEQQHVEIKYFNIIYVIMCIIFLQYLCHNVHNI